MIRNPKIDDIYKFDNNYLIITEITSGLYEKEVWYTYYDVESGRVTYPVKTKKLMKYKIEDGSLILIKGLVEKAKIALLINL